MATTLATAVVAGAAVTALAQGRCGNCWPSTQPRSSSRNRSTSSCKAVSVVASASASSAPATAFAPTDFVKDEKEKRPVVAHAGVSVRLKDAGVAVKVDTSACLAREDGQSKTKIEELENELQSMRQQLVHREDETKKVKNIFKQELDGVLLQMANLEGKKKEAEAESVKWRESTAEEAEKAKKEKEARQAQEAELQQQIKNLKRELTSEREKRAQREQPALPQPEAEPSWVPERSSLPSWSSLPSSPPGDVPPRSSVPEDVDPKACMVSLPSTATSFPGASTLRSEAAGRVPGIPFVATCPRPAAAQQPAPVVLLREQSTSWGSASSTRSPQTLTSTSSGSASSAPRVQQQAHFDVPLSGDLIMARASSQQVHGRALAPAGLLREVALEAPRQSAYATDDADDMDEIPREGVGIIHESAPSACLLGRTPRVNPPAEFRREGCDGPLAAEAPVRPVSEFRRERSDGPLVAEAPVRPVSEFRRERSDGPLVAEVPARRISEFRRERSDGPLVAEVPVRRISEFRREGSDGPVVGMPVRRIPEFRREGSDGPPMEIPPTSTIVQPMMRATQPLGARRVPAQQIRSRASYWSTESRPEERRVEAYRERTFPGAAGQQMAPRERSFPFVAPTQVQVGMPVLISSPRTATAARPTLTVRQ